eukprot:TRINITY_DN307_c0_g1_i3.p1 TRINITY_DN307_c0_g1~~TRINITY_DN307_c0_g1_i3.p1  ORF type:complete len:186 (+),score=46.90 TRINITY_DN307_c0_g1_i3:75-632(+)
MAARVIAGIALVATLAFSQEVSLDSALAADDACPAGGECGLELLQHRSEKEISEQNGANDAADKDDVAAKVEAAMEEGSAVTGGACLNANDKKVWTSGGKEQYDAALDHCGTSCAAGFPCTKSCMMKHGYSDGCAGCMAHAVECGRDHCLSQCISDHKSTGCLHCNLNKCRPVMRKCSGWAVGGH